MIKNFFKKISRAFKSIVGGAIVGAVLGAIGVFSFGAGFLAFFGGSAALAGAAVVGGLAAVSALLAPSAGGGLGGITGEHRNTQNSALPVPKWVVGRARTAGQLVYYKERDRVLHMAIVICAAPIDDIEAIFLDGELHSGRRGGDWDTGLLFGLPATELSIRNLVRGGGLFTGILAAVLPRVGGAVLFGGDNAVIRVYPSGNGTGGAQLRAASEGEWTTAHQLRGFAWAHVELRQPRYGNNLDKRRWTRIPNVEFLVKGQRIQMPWQSQPVWTENAASIYWWLLTERAGIPASAIDEDSVRVANNYCGQSVSLSLPEGYEDFPTTAIRYSINGVILGTDDIASIRDEFNFAWQGDLVESNGIIHFRPGRSPVLVGNIDEDNIYEPNGFSPGPAVRDRINAASMSLAQSREHGYLELSLPEFEDTEAVERDGMKLPYNLGTRAFVNDPVTAGRLLAIQLRRARSSARLSYRVVPSADLREYAWLPGDGIRVTDPQRGFDDVECVIEAVTRREDWLLDIDLVEYEANTYRETLVLPPQREIRLTPPRDYTPPEVPTGLAATGDAVIEADGVIRSSVSADWDDSAASYNTRITGPNDFSAVGPSLQPQIRYDVPEAGDYTVEVRAVSPVGIVSDPASAPATVSWAGLIPAPPRLLEGRQRGGVFNLIFEHSPERDITGIEARYRYAEEDGVMPPPIAEADWDALPRMDVVSIVPSVNGQTLHVSINIPESGQYRIAVRYITRQGLVSALSDIGDWLLVAPVLGSGTERFDPQFIGETAFSSVLPERDVLVYDSGVDYGNVDSLTKKDWDGRNGWPWGYAKLDDARTRTRIFRSSRISVGKLSNVRFRVQSTLYAPPGNPEPAPVVNMDWQVRGYIADGSIVWTVRDILQSSVEYDSGWMTGGNAETLEIRGFFLPGHSGYGLLHAGLLWNTLA